MTAPAASTGPTVVVVGASLAGATVATTLRADGWTGRIVLVGDEEHLPYERPPLSKAYLQGTAERSTVFVHPADWYDEHDVELRLGRTVTAIDRDAREVLLDDGERIGWTDLVLATGSSPRVLGVPGADLAGVLYLRRLEDSDELADAFVAADRVAIIGGGWIGLEVAAAARGAGLEVTVLEVAELPLLRVLGPRVATILADLHREHGVDLRTGVQVSELLTEDGRAVSGVRLADGSTVAADVVLVGIGIVPNVSLAADAGLEVDNGVVVDEHLRTADPHVLAAGDVANALHPVLHRRLRVEHWANATRQGEVAARTILGVDAVDARLPFFFTDQYDLGMEYVGYAEPDQYDEVVLRGDVAGRELLAFWVRSDGAGSGTVLAGANINIWDVSEQIEALIVSGRAVDLARLADPDVPLDQL